MMSAVDSMASVNNPDGRGLVELPQLNVSESA
jgi:hypothetical protein